MSNITRSDIDRGRKLLLGAIGSPLLLDGMSTEGTIDEGTRAAVMRELRRGFRPEFLNRIDEIALFLPLTRAEIKRIVALHWRLRAYDELLRLLAAMARPTAAPRRGPLCTTGGRRSSATR